MIFSYTRLGISIASRKIFFKSMTPAAWLRITPYSITEKRVCKVPSKPHSYSRLMPYTLFANVTSKSERKGKREILFVRRKVIDVPSQSEECLPLSLESSYKKRESQV